MKVVIKSFTKASMILPVLFFMLSITTLSYGRKLQYDAVQKDPRQIMSLFCKLDADGARLSSDTRRDIEQLLDWGEEGGYDEMVVIKSFKIHKEYIRKSTATVSVEYNVLGSTDSVDFSAVPGKKKVINFSLERIDGRWKIKEPIIAPHVNWRKAIDHLRLLQRNEPSRKKKLEGIIKKIGQAAE